MCTLGKKQNNMYHKVISGFFEEKEFQEGQNIGGEDYECLFYRGIF